MDKMPLWSNYGQNVHFKKAPNFLRPKTKKKFRKTEFSELFGGDKRDRTADLLNAIQALSQLSYTPIFGADIISLVIIATEQEFVKRYAEKLAI